MEGLNISYKSVIKLGRVEHHKTLRNKIVSEIRKSKRRFYNENIKGLRNNNAKKWWKSIKKIVGTTSHNFNLGNVVSENMSNKQTADYINKFFTSLTKDYLGINGEWLLFGSDEYLPKITVQSVVRKLSHINVNKTPGPFNPNLKLLKMFPEYFAIPLTDTYNQSFNHKIFPEVWKISNIASVPKAHPCMFHGRGLKTNCLDKCPIKNPRVMCNGLGFGRYKGSN